jgi:translation initiation factor IF-3
MAHKEIGEDVLHQFVNDLKEFGVMENKPTLEGKMMSIMVAPVGKKK